MVEMYWLMAERRKLVIERRYIEVCSIVAEASRI